MNYRTEHDFLGEKQIPEDKYWGIHTLRAQENFPFTGTTVHHDLIKSLVQVKLAAIITNHELGFIETDKFEAIQNACEDIINNFCSSQFPLSSLQGGAGTSTNMNVNEVIANKSLEQMNLNKGKYDKIHPIEDINLHQSTNDVYPTALKIAVIKNIRILASKIETLQGILQNKEKEFADIITLGRTEMQDATPITLGSQFASFAEAIGRDRWRIFKSEERIRIVNIGGTAVGTGLTAPKSYIFLVIEKLREITKMGLSRAEQVMDQTANMDCFTEVFGMLVTNAVNIIKISQDLRKMHYFKEINLQKKQTGSSIMPGKVNPVILESVIQVGIKVQNNSNLINQIASMGTFQINEFLPLLADTILISIDLLKTANSILSECVNDISANKNYCENNVSNNMIQITAFLPFIGYEKAQNLIKKHQKSDLSLSFKEFLKKELGDELVNKILSPQNLTSLGFKK